MYLKYSSLLLLLDILLICIGIFLSVEESNNLNSLSIIDRKSRNLSVRVIL